MGEMMAPSGLTGGADTRVGGTPFEGHAPSRAVRARFSGVVALGAVVLACAVAGAKPPAGPETVKWKRLPPDAFLCTRYGPDWERSRGSYPDVIKGRGYATPFRLTVPAGKELRFTLKATSSHKAPLRYSAQGLPAGVGVADDGAVVWTPQGGAGSQQELCFDATSANGPQAETWCMTLVIAEPARELLWSAGVGGKTWPDCGARPATQELLEVDLDGDGLKDALLSSSWSDPQDPMNHTFSRHELVLRRPRPGKPDGALRIAWRPGDDDGAFMGSVSLAETPDGEPLVVVKQHACDDRNPVELYRVTPKGIRSVGDFSPDPTGDSQLFSVTLERRENAVIAVVVEEGDKTTRYTWRRGAFR